MARKKKLSPDSFTPEEVKRLSKASTSTAMPNAVKEGLQPSRPIVAGVRLQPLSLDTAVQLELAKSPFLLGGEASSIDVLVALYILMTDPDEVDQVVSDPVALTKAARQNARQIPMTSIGALGDGIAQHLQTSFSTSIQTAPEDESEKKTQSAGN